MNQTPAERITAECAAGGGAALIAGGGAALIAGCAALLERRPDEVDDRLITLLGGPAAAHVLDGGEGGRSGHWPRIWAARGLLHALDHHPADATAAAEVTEVAAGADVTDAIIAATADSAWRVSEMSAKVIARHRLGRALDAVVLLRDDPVPGSAPPPPARSSR